MNRANLLVEPPDTDGDVARGNPRGLAAIDERTRKSIRKGGFPPYMRDVDR